MLEGGAINLGTLVVPAGGEDWTPLARVLRYFYADEAGTTAGPVAFSEINRLHHIAVLPAEAWVMEEGATQWKSVAAVLSAAGATIHSPPAPVAAPAVAIPRTATGAYRPPAAATRAVQSHAADPYAPPKAHHTRTVIRHRATGGINRMQYFLFSILLNVLLFGGILAVGAVGFRSLETRPEGAREQFDTLFNQSAAAVLIIFAITAIGGIILALLRIQNIGWRWYFIFLNLVPLVSIWFAIALLAYPPGYARHRRLDTPAKVIVAIVVFLFVAGIIVAIASGGKSVNRSGTRVQPASLQAV
jgi:hypothetical protein